MRNCGEQQTSLKQTDECLPAAGGRARTSKPEHSSPVFWMYHKKQGSHIYYLHMTETLAKSEFPEHFDVHHENNEALMCLSSGGECRVLAEIKSAEFGYTPEEERRLLQASVEALGAIDHLADGKATDLFAGLHIIIGEDLAGGGAVAQAEKNEVLVNGRKTLLTLDEMKDVSGAYDKTELTDFPKEQQPDGGLKYTLVHEIGHILDGRTQAGTPYQRVAQEESPTRYGREPDEWSNDKRHEAFAEGFAHMAWGMPVSDAMQSAVRKTIQARLQELSLARSASAEVTSTVSLVDMDPEQLDAWFDADNIHNGSHFMSSADNDKYQELCAVDMKQAVMFLRDTWGQYADQEFLQSFALVHWVGSAEGGLEDLQELLGDSRHAVEISTQGYRDEVSLRDEERWLDARFGVLVDGQINLASNADIQTNQWLNVRLQDADVRPKYTEWANRLMTSESNCVSPYEFVIGNWHAIGIVVDPNSAYAHQAIALAKRYDLRVVDTQQNNLFIDKEDPNKKLSG